MKNPLFNQISNPNVNDFKSKLSQIDNSFLERMQAEARKRGIAEKDIQQGMTFIKQLKRA